MALKPHWLDDVIEPHLESSSAEAIAIAIAKNERFLAAIRKGLAHKPAPGMAAPGHAQNVRESIRQELNAED